MSPLARLALHPVTVVLLSLAGAVLLIDPPAGAFLAFSAFVVEVDARLAR